NVVGCFLLAVNMGHASLYLALGIIAFGYGLFTPSLVTLLGHAYRDTPHLREAGFSIYYASINVGVFLALVSLGTIAKLYSWPLAFLVAAFVQIIGLVPIILYLRRYRHQYLHLKTLQHEARKIK